MNQRLTIHKANLADLDQVLDLYARATRHLEAKGIHQWDEAYLSQERLQADIQAGELSLFRDETKLIGASVLNAQQDQEFSDAAWRYHGASIGVIHRFCIAPEAQGKGYGRCSMMLFERRAREQGYEIMRLDAFEHNPVSNALYQSLGYRIAGEVRYLDGAFICIGYEKKLAIKEEKQP